MSGLADFLRVVRELDPDGADADRAAELVGLRRTRLRAPVPQAELLLKPLLKLRPSPRPLHVRPEEETPLPLSVERHAPAATPPGWLLTPEEVKPEELRYRHAEIALEPLLQPLSTRAILTAFVATEAPGSPDLDALIGSIAAREPIRHIRRLPAYTVSRGVQVLVDRSPSMAPFREDQNHLALQLRRIIGAPRVSVVDFMESPLRGAGIGAIDTWKDYVPPPARTPVLLLTDLGIGREYYSGATTGEWLSFAREMRTAGCPLLALVPYPPVRWPRILRESMAIAQWDRTLTARGARRVVRSRSGAP